MPSAMWYAASRVTSRAPRPAAGESLPDAGAQLGDALVGDAGAMSGDVSHGCSFVATRGARAPRGARAAGRWPSRGTRRWISSAAGSTGSCPTPRAAATPAVLTKYEKTSPKSPSVRCGTSSARPARADVARLTHHCGALAVERRQPAGRSGPARCSVSSSSARWNRRPRFGCCARCVDQPRRP